MNTVAPSWDAKGRRTGWFIALFLAFSITLTQQKWVGGMSIYDPELVSSRELMHDAILRNQLPDSVGSWSDLGANGLNIRLATVLVVEGLHRVTGLTVQHCYLIIETLALFACCLLLCAFLAPSVGWPYALAGLLYFGNVLPLTYLNHRFHPWDKPSIALWLLALICVRQRWWWSLAGVLVVGVATKYDILVFPLLAFLAYRKSDPARINVLRAGSLMALAVLTFAFLRWKVPGGFEPRSIPDQLAVNLSAIRDTLFAYPPFLALGLPATLAAVGYASADEFARSCVQLFAVVAIILFLQTNFVEFRAEVPLLILLLPCAWFGLQRLAGFEIATSSARET